MLRFSCSRQGKGATGLDEIELRRVSPENFGTGRDEVATLRVWQAQKRPGNIQAGFFGCSGQWARQARQSGQVSSLRATAFPCITRIS